MSTRKTAPRRKAGQRNAQRGASHVGSGDVVVLGLSAARALRLQWRGLQLQLQKDAKEAAAKGMHVTAGVLDGTVDGLEICIKSLRRRIADAMKRQPQHNTELRNAHNENGKSL